MEGCRERWVSKEEKPVDALTPYKIFSTFPHFPGGTLEKLALTQAGILTFIKMHIKWILRHEVKYNSPSISWYSKWILFKVFKHNLGLIITV